MGATTRPRTVSRPEVEGGSRCGSLCSAVARSRGASLLRWRDRARPGAGEGRLSGLRRVTAGRRCDPSGGRVGRAGRRTPQRTTNALGRTRRVCGRRWALETDTRALESRPLLLVSSSVRRGRNPTSVTSSEPSQARFCHRHHAFQVQGSPQPRYARPVRHLPRPRRQSSPRAGRCSLPRCALATEKRKQEAQRIREKYPDRVPVRTGARPVAPAGRVPVPHAVPTSLSLPPAFAALGHLREGGEERDRGD